MDQQIYLLYGYGSYGKFNESPNFSSTRLSLIDRDIILGNRAY